MSAPAQAALTPDLTGIRAAVVNWRDLDHSQAGGAERYAWEYARALAERGATVDFVTARDRGQSRTQSRDGIRIRRWGGTFGFYALAAAYLLRHRRTLDLVIDPECGIPVFSPLFVGRRTAVVLIVHHIHQRQFAQYFPAPLAKVGQLLEGRVMPRVYRNVRTLAVSESTAQEMRSELGWSGPIELLHNGANLPRRRPHSTHNPRRVVALGRLVAHKNVDLVVELIDELRHELPGLRLDIIGRGPAEESVRAEVSRRGLSDHVTVHGFVSDDAKDELLAQAGLQICASDNEGWGQVVIECAAHGVPTVARTVPGLRDSIRHGQTGWLAAPDDGSRPGARAALLEAARVALAEIAQQQRAAELSEACLTHANAFDWARMREKAATIGAQEVASLGG